MAQGETIMKIKERFRKISTVSIVFAILLTLLTACMTTNPQANYRVLDINNEIEACTGTDLTYSETLEKMEEFSQLISKYDGKAVGYNSINETDEVIHLKMIKPTQMDKSDDTRYNINTLSKEYGIYRGIKVTLISSGSTETEPSESEEFNEEVATTDTSLDEQAAISAWLDFLDGWWVGDLNLTADDYEETKQGRVNWRLGIEMNKDNSLSIEQNTGALVIDNNSGDKSWIYKVDDDHILVKTTEGEAKWVRDNSQD